jgi:hypothetical protein
VKKIAQNVAQDVLFVKNWAPSAIKKNCPKKAFARSGHPDCQPTKNTHAQDNKIESLLNFVRHLQAIASVHTVEGKQCLLLNACC